MRKYRNFSVFIAVAFNSFTVPIKYSGSGDFSGVKIANFPIR